MANDGTVKIGTELDDSGFKSGLSKLGSIASGALKGIATAAAGASAGLLALESATEEYRIAQGKLNTAFEAAGYSTETAKTAYTEFYKILGDVDTATEASQLLAKLARSEEDVTKWTQLSAGVWGTFGDSLPIEGLIESANETAKVGVVTGSLADALNWAGISEDEFNKKLESAGSEAERNKLILETLSGTYDEASDAFYRNNEAIVSSREAQAQLDESLATLGETVADLKSRILSELLPGVVQVTDAFSGMLSGTEGADEQFVNAISSLVSSLMERLPEFLNFGVQILTALLQGIVQSIPTLVSAVPQIVQSIFTALQEMLPTLMQVGSSMLSQIAQGIISAIPMIGETAYSLLTSFGSYLQENLPSIMEQGLQFVVNLTSAIRDNAGLIIDGALALIQSLAQGLMDSLPTLIQNIPTIVSNIANVINDNAPKILAAGVQLIITLGKGLINAIPTLIQNIPAIISAAVDAFLAFNWLNLGASIIKAIGNGLKSMGSFIATNAKSIVETIKTGFNNLPSKMLEVGKNIIQGLWNGVTSLKDWLKSKISSLASSVVGWAKDVLGIKSPSRVFRDQIGKNIGLGLAAGIDASKDDALKAADELAKSVYTKSKEWLDKQVKYQDYGLREQLEVWHAIQDQFISSSQQYADAEEEILDIRHKILQENLDLEEEYQKQLSDLSQDIFDSYKLFEEVPEAQAVAGQDLINNLQNQVNSIESFYAALDELYSRGVGEDLVNEIKNMGVDAADQLNALLALSDDQLSEYAELYREKQKLANELAIEELADLREQTDDEIQKNLDALEGKFEEEAPDVGEALPAGLAIGIMNGKSSVISATIAVATAAINAAKSTLDIHSPSKVFEDVGSNVGLGLANGIMGETDTVRNAANRMVSELERAIPSASMSISAANTSMASIPSPRFSTENAITRAAGMISLSQGTQEREIVLQVNGREFARAVVPDIRAVESQSPAIVYS